MNVKSLLTLIFIIVYSSCTTLNNDSTLAGKWKLVDMSLTPEFENDTSMMELLEDVKIENVNHSYMEIKKDGSYISSFPRDTFFGNWMKVDSFFVMTNNLEFDSILILKFQNDTLILEAGGVISRHEKQ